LSIAAAGRLNAGKPDNKVCYSIRTWN